MSPARRRGASLRRRKGAFTGFIIGRWAPRVRPSSALSGTLVAGNVYLVVWRRVVVCT